MKRRLLTICFVVVIALLGSAQVWAEWSPVQLWPHSTSAVERMASLYGNTMYFVIGYDVYTSQWDNGTWTEPQAVPGAINTGVNELHPIVVGGGKVMYFLRMTEENDYDYFRSMWDEAAQAWGEPARVDEFSTPTQDWDIWIDENETIAYLTTKGTYGDQGSFGARDIWKSVKEDGKWTTPENIGSPINSSGSEWSVWVDEQGRIYFDSTREGTAGGYDVFVAESETGPISSFSVANTAANERSICVTENMMIVSALNREGGAGNYDLFYSVNE